MARTSPNAAVRSLTQPVIDEADVVDDLGVCRFRFNPDGRYLAVESGGSSHVYDLARREKAGQLHHEGSTLRFGSGGRFLVGWSSDLDMVEVWDLTRTEAPLFEVPLSTGKTERDGSGRLPLVALDEETQRLRYVADSTGQFYGIDLAGALDAGVTTPSPPRSRPTAASRFSGPKQWSTRPCGWSTCAPVSA